MKQQSYQSIYLVFIWLVFIWPPLLAKEPMQTDDPAETMQVPYRDSATGPSLVTTEGNGRSRFVDNFTLDLLHQTTHYVEWMDEGFHIQNGILKAAVPFRQKACLQIFPSFGRDFEFSADVQYDGDPLAEAGFTLLISGGNSFKEPVAGINVELNKSRVSGWYGVDPGSGNRQMEKDYFFLPKKWYICKVSSGNGSLSLFINNDELLKIPLIEYPAPEMVPDDPENDGTEVSEEPVDFSMPRLISPGRFALFSGAEGSFPGTVNFSLYVEGKTANNEFSFDNLIITGKTVQETAGYKALKSRFLLGRKMYQLAVLFEPGYEQWAAGQLNDSVKYLQNIYETVYQIAPYYQNLGLIQYKDGIDLQRIKALYSESLSVIGASRPGMDGSPDNAAGELKAKATLKQPDTYALLCFWSGYYAESWIRNSIPYVIQNIQDALAGKLVTLKDIHHLHRQLESTDKFSGEFIDTFVNTPLASPVSPGLWKAHIFWYIVYRLIGIDGWQKLHKELVSSARSLDSMQLKSSLENITGTSLTSLFTGWITPGKGKYNPADALLDSDHDGLFDLDEQLYGTNPLKADTDSDNYPDFSEIQAGYDPTDKKNPEQGVILIDGDFFDWSSTYIYDVDEVHDGDKYDLYTLKYAWDRTNDLLFLKISFFTPLFKLAAGKQEHYYTQIQFDTNNDHETDYRFVFWSGSGDSRDWVGGYKYESVTGPGSSRKKQQIEFDDSDVSFKTGADCLELVIPLTHMNTNKASFFAIMIDGGQDTQLDRFDTGWIKIIPVMPYTIRPKKVWTPAVLRTDGTKIK